MPIEELVQELIPEVDIRVEFIRTPLFLVREYLDLLSEMTNATEINVSPPLSRFRKYLTANATFRARLSREDAERLYSRMYLELGDSAPVLSVNREVIPYVPFDKTEIARQYVRDWESRDEFTRADIECILGKEAADYIAALSHLAPSQINAQDTERIHYLAEKRKRTGTALIKTDA